MKNIGRNWYDAEKSEPVEFITCAEFEVRNEGQKQNIIATGISKFFLLLLDSNDVSAGKCLLRK